VISALSIDPDGSQALAGSNRITSESLCFRDCYFRPSAELSDPCCNSGETFLLYTFN
jgi:hypothetical protein